MKVNWILEDCETFHNIDLMRDEIIRQGHYVKIIEYTVLKKDNSLNLYPAESCILFYGSLQTTRQIQLKQSWIPGVICNSKNFDCTTYYNSLGRLLVNQDYVMLPAREVFRLKETLNRLFGSHIFIRPNNCMKSFVGKVVEIDSLAARHFDYCLDSLVIVSSAKNILTEYRCVVADSQVIAATIYKRDRQDLAVTVDISSADFQPFLARAREITRCWEPDRIYMLDLAEYDCLKSPKAKSNIGLMELNSFSSSGLYGCELESVVREASRIAIEEWKDLNS